MLNFHVRFLQQRSAMLTSFADNKQKFSDYVIKQTSQQVPPVAKARHYLVTNYISSIVRKQKQSDFNDGNDKANYRQGLQNPCQNSKLKVFDDQLLFKKELLQQNCGSIIDDKKQDLNKSTQLIKNSSRNGSLALGRHHRFLLDHKKIQFLDPLQSTSAIFVKKKHKSIDIHQNQQRKEALKYNRNRRVLCSSLQRPRAELKCNFRIKKNEHLQPLVMHSRQIAVKAQSKFKTYVQLVRQSSKSESQKHFRILNQIIDSSKSTTIDHLCENQRQNNSQMRKSSFENHKQYSHHEIIQELRKQTCSSKEDCDITFSPWQDKQQIFPLFLQNDIGN